MSETTTAGYLDMELLRFTTAGSVDDGKSTLIGRLLYDSKAIFQDQMEAVEKASKKMGGDGEVNLALLTDGLRSEREQGITIDVAYRYFATPKRKFIIADTPGHIQYTRNMVTGASTANLAIILVDARHGMVEQTCRHSFIASLLGIKHVVYCINKMDLVDYSQEKYEQIKSDLEDFTAKLEISDIRYIPISALLGDNVVDRSKKMDWFEGATLLYTLESVHIGSDENHVDVRFPVQYVVRPQTKEYHDYRGYAGRVAGGILKKGDEVTVFPSGFNSKIAKIDTMDGEIEEAFPPMSCTILLEDDIDVSRGDMISRVNNQPRVEQDHDLMVCWMSQRPIQLNGKYAVKHTSRDARCIVKEIRYKVDINTLHKIEDDKNIQMNDIARIVIRTTVPLFTDRYLRNRHTGSLVLIDEATNETVGAGMLI
ncbi:MAG: sulfate adenylyltransferase subunit CysN [Flavobacteriales bacterium]|jgi:sulfate adenylyltransferase subunit 1|nr:sulfate adenylyltransferase subunit CysN [Flavobacteriales bacterium]NCG29096.1 sulfate adenylyltransferase subunit CysN [Bacteroidota bacterium]MBT3962742.1 sulfate adenylyltransferase subunit CysN [Flavobacteriales bacterium]MBT4705907.1 sulfate adenylyltransferase subunit CysN [Flavobacteriales bacterium]MBT4929575.1 sulfate adenylyltransferase subunit CysN [Flavobacteriales bacterium]